MGGTCSKRSNTRHPDWKKKLQEPRFHTEIHEFDAHLRVPTLTFRAPTLSGGKMGPYHGSQFTLHKEDPRLLSRIMPHFEAQVTCSLLFAFSQAGMCGVRTSRVQTGSPIMNQAPNRPVDSQPSFRNTRVAATPMANQGTLLPFPRDRYVQTGLEGLQTCPRFYDGW